MANALTAGFDAVAHLSEEMLARLLLFNYFSNPKLQALSQTTDASLAAIGVEISGGVQLLLPSVTLHVDRLKGKDSTLQLVLPFDGNINVKQIPPILWVPGIIGSHHVTGIMRITVSLTKTVGIDAVVLNKAAARAASQASSRGDAALAAEIATAALIAILSTSDPAGVFQSLDAARANTTDATLSEALAGLIDETAYTAFVIDLGSVSHEQFSVNITNIELGPLKTNLEAIMLFGALGFDDQHPGALRGIPPLRVLTLSKGILNRVEIVTKNSPAAGDPTCLALFVMFTGDGPDTPADVPVLLDSIDDYAMATSKEGFDALAPKAILSTLHAKSFPIELDVDIPVVHSTLLKSLNFKLGNGEIDVSGRITLTYDCWWDTDIDFSGPVYVDKNLKATPGNFNVDLPEWLDILDVFIPIIGSIIHKILDDAAQEMGSGFVSGVGVPSPFNAQSFGVAGVKPLRVENSSAVVTPDGITVHGRLFLYTYVGNARTREIHVFSDTKWIGEMSERNKVYRERYQEYLAQGYNGCAFCFSQLDTG